MSDPHPSSIGAKSRTVRRFAGELGAVSTAHPLATAAGREILASGGTAADAAVAAQAALCVVLPQSCGLGGDGLVVVEARDGGTEAFHGAGATPAAWVPSERDDASRATVPGVVDAWANLSERHGRRPLAAVLAPAARLAEDGIVVDDIL